jgi:hypothetical protein
MLIGTLWSSNTLQGLNKKKIKIKSIVLVLFKGSDQWETRGAEKVANNRYRYQTVVIEVLLSFYLAAILELFYFLFRSLSL